MTDKTTYKDPLYVLGWLDTVLKKERRKYMAIPVTPDMVPSHEIAQAWGYAIPRMNGKAFVSCRATRYIRQ